MSDGNVVVCTFNFLSLMFIFKLATKKQWMIINNDRSQDQVVTRADIESRYGDQTPNLGIWDQFGLLIGIAAVVLIVIVASLF